MKMSRFSAAFHVIKELYRPSKLRVGLLAGFGLFNGLLGALGVGGVIPLFSLILHKEVEQKTIVFRFFEWALAGLSLTSNVYSILIVIILLFIGKAIIFFLFKYTGLILVSNYEVKMRKDLYRTSLSARWPYLIHQKIGHLENTLMTDVGGVLRLMSTSISLVHSVTSLLMYLFIAFAISSYVTLAALGGGGAFLFLYRPFLRRMRVYGKAQTKVNKKISHEINENAIGLKVIKAMRIEKEVAESGIRFFDEVRMIRVRTGIAKAIGSALLSPLTVVFISIFFLVSYRNPLFDLATFIAVVYLIQQIFVFVDKIQDGLSEMHNAVPFARNVLAFQDEIYKNQEDNAGTLPFSFAREIRFQNVEFSHGAKPVLARVSFSIKKGEMLGIIGPSGAGKTTVADLLLRLFEPQEGEITLDGINIREIQRDEWRKNIGYVPQEVFLKNATIADNIKFYNPAVSDADMEEASRMAHIYDVICELPNRFNSVVGERGVFLSGGQRQRIILARILARKPNILLLDEATSALDNESEAAIERAITSLKGEITVIIIAHRLTTVMHCDRVLALEEGHAIEEGEPHALLADPDSYFHKMHALRK